MNVRVGYGFDVHKLEAGLPFALGGIVIHHNKGPIAHSDGDVLIHALCDALLGATGQDDIGHQFPDDDPKWKDADSKLLLAETMRLVSTKGFKIVNVDCSVLLEAPKIAPHIAEMREVLSPILGVAESLISIKATTMEGLGLIGREEGVAALVAVLVSS